MAKTVAEIDGDSSGLVGELGKAKKAMGDLGGEGRKLTDQLKDVADQADVAAGNLVNALGGPGAIKAIGGIGIAMGGAKMAVDAFMDSAENMFRGMGPDGQAVWDQVEQSLFSVKGAFAEAVLGTDDMYEAGGRLEAMFDLVKEAFDSVLVLISPLTIGFRGLLELFTDFTAESEANAKALREQAQAQDQVKKSSDMAATSLQTLKEKMMALRGETENLRDIQLASYQMEAKMTGERILEAERVQDEAEAKGAVAARMEEINKLTSDQVGLMVQYGAVANDAEAREAAYAERFKLNSAAVLAEEIKKREGLSASRKAEYDEATRLYLEFEMMRLTNEGAPKKDKTGTGSSAVKEAEQDAYALRKISMDEWLAADRLREENDRTEREMADAALKEAIERIEAETKAKEEALQRVNDFSARMLQEHNEELHAQGKLTLEEQAELDAQRVQAFKDRMGQELGLYMQTAGKQFAIGELSAKKAADLARQQLGNIIMGLGDKAMVEAGIMAAAGNPMAIPMVAAGTAAYAVGGLLAADKKAAGSTPATEKASAIQPAVNNYSFNMQVDSVFADGESVARQFAMMQESARQRGLLAQGAY